MNQTDFTIFLPSNSSAKYFPNNTTTNFSTRLPKEIELYGRWVVGLSEIHVPCTSFHLRREDCILKNDNVNEKPRYFQHGTYTTIQCLIDTINDTVTRPGKKELCMKLFYNERGGFVSIGFLAKNNTVKICSGPDLSPAVQRILGFELGVNPTDVREQIDNYQLRLVGAQPASFARTVPDQLFVYSNLCEPSIVGDTHAPLLRIVNIEARKFDFGTTIVKHFGPVHYVPVLVNRFQTIDIDIRDQFGKPIPFEFGTLTAALHFKRAH